MAARPPELVGLFLSSQYSDAVVLSRDGEAFSIHKSIVFPQAPGLADDFNGGKSCSSPFGSIVVRAVLEYLYKGEYFLNGNFHIPQGSATNGVQEMKRSFPLLEEGEVDEVPPAKRTRLTEPLESGQAIHGDAKIRLVDPTLLQQDGVGDEIPIDMVLHAQIYCAANIYGIVRLVTKALARAEEALQASWNPGVFPSLLEMPCVVRTAGPLLEVTHERPLHEVPALAQLTSRLAADHIHELKTDKRFLAAYFPQKFGEETLHAIASKRPAALEPQNVPQHVALAAAMTERIREEVHRKEVETLKKAAQAKDSTEKNLKSQIKSLHKASQDKNKFRVNSNTADIFLEKVFSQHNTLGRWCPNCIPGTKVRFHIDKDKQENKCYRLHCEGCQVKLREAWKGAMTL